jgi:predicted ester cyclase
LTRVCLSDAAGCDELRGAATRSALREVAHIHETEAAFPAYELIAEEMIAERNIVAMRGTFQGVHRGAIAGVSATGRSVSAAFMIFYRVEGNRIADHWLQLDGASLMAQLQSAVMAQAIVR